jgi:WS/DGAT C-terminal domain
VSIGVLLLYVAEGDSAWPNFSKVRPRELRVTDTPKWMAHPFGPLVGAAANCALVGYNHQAFVGINVDAAAVSDLDMLAGCIREGFDAVIALGDVG